MSYRYLRNFLMSPNVLIRRFASDKDRTLVLYDRFTDLEKRDRHTYIQMLRKFQDQDKRRRGHVEFIYSALKHMKEFGVHKDLEVYKELLEVFPQGKFLPTNIFQAEFMHYPKQQQCAVDVLDQMEENGVMPDFEMEDILMNIFGKRGIPLRKFWRMMYWMPKFRHISPWKLPQQLPNDTLDLAKLAIERITSVDPDTKMDIYETKDIAASLDDTWIVSAQSLVQRKLLAKQPANQPLTVYGAFTTFLRDQKVTYFTLEGAIRDPKEEDVDIDDVSNIDTRKAFRSINLPVVAPSVHEQDDGTILAICATGTSSRDSLLSWIRLLEINGNPSLANTPVIFTLTAPPNAISLRPTEPVASKA